MTNFPSFAAPSGENRFPVTLRLLVHDIGQIRPINDLKIALSSQGGNQTIGDPSPDASRLGLKALTWNPRTATLLMGALMGA